jgi:methionyl-tRNA synthetase
MGLNLFRLLALYLKPVLPGVAAQVEQFLQIPPLCWAISATPLLGSYIAEFKPLMQRVEMAQIAASLRLQGKFHPAVKTPARRRTAGG